MKVTRTRAMVPMLLGLIACGPPKPPPPPPPVFSIDGTVLLTGTADASRVAVSLSQGQDRVAEVDTAEDGAYHFDLEETGVYTLSFHDDYSVERDVSFDVLVDGAIRAPDTTLTPLGVIKAITRPIGDCPGFTLQVFVRGFSVTGIDPEGRSEIVVPIGPYEVFFFEGFPSPYSEKFDVSVGHGVTVVEPAGLPSWRIREGSIRGVVSRAPAPPAAGSVVEIVKPCLRTTVTDAAGAYSFSALPSGPNELGSHAPESTFEATGYGVFLWWQTMSKWANPVVMPGVESVVDFQWRPVVTVRGRVMSGGVPVAAQICSTPGLPIESATIPPGPAVYLPGDAGIDGRYEMPAPLDVTEVHVCSAPSISVPITAAFGQVTQAPDLVIP